MRAVIQRVKSASVSIANKTVANIEAGLLILLGVEGEDTLEDAKWLAAKIAKMRIFSDADGHMNLSILDTYGQAIVVSQFTLHAGTKKGNRPSFIKAARPEIAIPLYEQFISIFEAELGKEVGRGQFGAMMDVSLINDGPVTIIIDSKRKE